MITLNQKLRNLHERSWNFWLATQKAELQHKSIWRKNMNISSLKSSFPQVFISLVFFVERFSFLRLVYLHGCRSKGVKASLKMLLNLNIKCFSTLKDILMYIHMCTYFLLLFCLRFPPIRFGSIFLCHFVDYWYTPSFLHSMQWIHQAPTSNKTICHFVFVLLLDFYVFSVHFL